MPTSKLFSNLPPIAIPIKRVLKDPTDIPSITTFTEDLLKDPEILAIFKRLAKK